ncbi:MAG: hypothetical protein IJH07_02040 [Ruminococcus sp.]|nr:hypothetical protein [Ruminococcus sp.]
MNKKTIAASEAAGAVVIYCAAVFLHFVYPLSSGAALSILFGAVNESVWEHTKIFSAAYIGWSLLQLCWLKVRFRQYVASKCIGLYTLMGLIIGVFYAYTALTGHNIVWVDVLSSLLSVMLVQWMTYRLETGANRLGDYFAPALMLLMLYYLMFFSFTVFPPKADLFRDPVSGGYGVIGRIAAKKR